MRQYISDIITQSEIAKWVPKNRILIDAQTGFGKSQFVKNELYNHCKKNNKKILLLSNRNALKNQNNEELKDSKLDVITLKNYQAIESMVLFGSEILELFRPYNYIIFDECHYLTSDANFSNTTDILLSQIKNPLADKIYIFLSATPDVIRLYENNFDFEYIIPKDYSYIENLYFYSKAETLNNILEKIPYDEKVIYFGTALESLELSLLFADSAFICSENNKEFYRKSSKSVSQDIEENACFKPRMLFSTKVIDNGINIIDNKLKHIIIDLFDPIDVIQCLGRKRMIDNNDKVNLYIKNYHGGEIYPRIQRINDKLAQVKELEELGKEEFQKKYARSAFDSVIRNDFEINQAKIIYYKYIKSIAGKMIANKDTDGYKRFIAQKLDIEFDNIKVAEEYYEKECLSDILEQYTGKRMYKGDAQELFKEKFFNKLFDPKRRLDYRNRGYNTINTILQEDELPFYITTHLDRDTYSQHKNKKYWVVNKSAVPIDIIKE